MRCCGAQSHRRERWRDDIRRRHRRKMPGSRDRKWSDVERRRTQLLVVATDAVRCHGNVGGGTPYVVRAGTSGRQGLSATQRAGRPVLGHSGVFGRQRPTCSPVKTPRRLLRAYHIYSDAL